MSVVGSLEDLSFPDILQIVHLSRQSGTLVLTAADGERRVRFQNGRVSGATLGTRGPELEEVLLRKGLVSRASLQAARERHAQSGEPLSSALVGQGAVSQETIERVVREELGSMLRSLVLLQDGEFRFDIEREEHAPSGPGLGLREGLEPSSILPELPAHAPFESSPRLQAAAGESRNARRALLVVERSYLRLALRDDLLQHQWDVNCCSTSAVGRDLARSLLARGIPFHLICDLLLPDATGGGWFGGLELVHEVRRMAPDLTAIVIGEVKDPRLAEKARAAGASDYLSSPDLAGVGLDRVAEALGGFCEEVRTALRRRRASGGAPPAPGSIRVSDPLSLLRGLIGELRSDEDAEIPLLVLRLAAEYFERGSLFMVRGNDAFGIGGFGTAGPEEDRGVDGRVRGMALSLLPGSALERAAASAESVIGPIPRTPENAALFEALGTPPPGEAALLPLSISRKTFGILYGDNAASRRPLGDLKALEIFLSQAAFALENAFLQRQIESLAHARPAGEKGNRHGSSGAKP